MNTIASSAEVDGAPATVVGSDRALVSLFVERSDRDGDRLALRYKQRGIWREVSWADYRNHVERLALGLLRLDVGAGDTVGVMARAVPEWLYADLAAQSIGAVPTGFFLTTPPAELARQLLRSGTRVLIIESMEFLDRLLSAEALVGEQLVDHIVVTARHSLLDPNVERVHEVAELAQWAEQDLDGDPDVWRRMVAQRSPDEPVRLLFTPGTTGDPKGVLISSRNLIGSWGAFFQSLDPAPGPDDRSVSHMPMAHVGEMVFSTMLPILFGSVPHFPEDEEAVAEALIEVSPTLLFTFPRLLELYASNALIDLDNGRGLKRRLYRLAGRLRSDSAGIGRIGAWLAYQLMYRHLLNKFGFQKVRVALTGGSAVSPDLIRLWDQWGLRLTEFYGLAEIGGLAAVTRPGAGAAMPVPGVGVRLNENGEIEVRGSGELLGYLPGETGTTVDTEAWLPTGDLGAASEDGGFRVLGRKEAVIRTADGSMVHPTEIEQALEYDPYIRDALVLEAAGSGLVALLGLDLENLALWAREQEILFTAAPELITNPKVAVLVQRLVDGANQRLAASGSPHRIADFRLLPKELEPGYEITPIGVMKRRYMVEEYEGLVESNARPAAEVAERDGVIHE